MSAHRIRIRARGLWLPILAALPCLLLPRCRFEQTSAREEKFITVKLNDSLSRFSSVKVLVLADGDTGQVVGTLWDGNLKSPGSIPSYRVDDGETRVLSIRVLGFDGNGWPLLDMRISKDGGQQAVATVALPNPSPELASLRTSVGNLVPAFDHAVKSYALALAPGQTAFTVTMSPAYPPASLLVGFAKAFAGKESDSIFARARESHVTINVTAGDTSAQYHLTVTRPVPSSGDSGSDTGANDSTGASHPEWKHAALLNLDFNQAGIGPGMMVTDFPLLLRLTKGNFRLADAATDGKDIRFATADGHELPYEISRWDPLKGEAEIWIKTDTLRSEGGNKPILMYWGDADATALSDPAGTFPTASGWTGVWHLEETGKGVEGEFKDATGKYHGTGGGAGKFAPSHCDGLAGGGQDFKVTGSPQGLIFFPTAFDPGEKAWTLQMWVKRNGNEQSVLFSKDDGSAESQRRVRISTVQTVTRALSLSGKGGEFVTDAQISQTDLQLIAFAWDGKTVRLYVNGFIKQSTDWTQGNAATASAVLGAVDDKGASGFHGVIDEFWASSVDRSADYMRLIFENQKPNSGFVTVLPL